MTDSELAPVHAPILTVKDGGGYTDENGNQVAPHLLFRYLCRCGWKGAAWYASQERASRRYDSHAGRGWEKEELKND